MTDLRELADLSHEPDAAKWAASFKQKFPDADEGLMLGWFANAMMAMHDWLLFGQGKEKALAALRAIASEQEKG